MLDKKSIFRNLKLCIIAQARFQFKVQNDFLLNFLLINSSKAHLSGQAVNVNNQQRLGKMNWVNIQISIFEILGVFTLFVSIKSQDMFTLVSKDLFLLSFFAELVVHLDFKVRINLISKIKLSLGFTNDEELFVCSENNKKAILYLQSLPKNCRLKVNIRLNLCCKESKRQILQSQLILLFQQPRLTKNYTIHLNRIVLQRMQRDNNSIGSIKQGDNDNQRFEVFVKTLTGKSITFQVTPQTVVYEFMESIHDRQGFPPSEMLLILRYQKKVKALRNFDQTFADLGVKKGSIFDLLVRFQTTQATNSEEYEVNYWTQIFQNQEGKLNNQQTQYKRAGD